MLQPLLGDELPMALERKRQSQIGTSSLPWAWEPRWAATFCVAAAVVAVVVAALPF